MIPKTGPYTIDELFSFWQSIVDRGYSQPFVEQLKGLSIDSGADIPVVLANPKGSEVFTQMMAQAKKLMAAADQLMNEAKQFTPAKNVKSKTKKTTATKKQAA